MHLDSGFYGSPRPDVRTIPPDPGYRGLALLSPHLRPHAPPGWTRYGRSKKGITRVVLHFIYRGLDLSTSCPGYMYMLGLQVILARVDT
jgi:hypothetical protein